MIDSEQITIRRIEESDLPRVVALGSSTANFEVGEKSRFWEEKTLRHWITTSDDPLILAEEGNELLGFILGAVHHPTGKVTLENIVVDERRRRRGVGRLLLGRFMEELTKFPVDYVCALSKTTNTPAINLFLKHGFQRGYDFTWL